MRPVRWCATIRAPIRMLDPDPARDPAAYNRICQQTPTATHCGLPLYWPAPSIRVGTKAGMHRFAWDLHYDPIPVANVNDNGNVEAKGAVPHRTFPVIDAPWAPPGQYTVRLTVDGTTIHAAAHAATRSAREDVASGAGAAGHAVARDVGRVDRGQCGAGARRGRWLAHRSRHVRAPRWTSVQKQLETLAPPRWSARRFRRPGRQRGTDTDWCEHGDDGGGHGHAGRRRGTDRRRRWRRVRRREEQQLAAMAAWNRLRTTGLAAINAERGGRAAAAHDS